MKKYKVKDVNHRNYSVIRLLNTKASTYDFTIYDEHQLRVIGFNSKGPATFSKPEGANTMVDSLKQGKIIFGFDVIHIEGDVYRLESQLELGF